MKGKMFVLVLLSGVLLAQPPVGRGFGMKARRGAALQREAMARNMDALKDTLGLTDTQVQQLRDLRRQRAEAARPTLEQLRANRKALAEAMQAQSPDTARVGQLMVDRKKLRESLRAAGEDYRGKAQALLTPEQKAKLAGLQQAGRRAGAARQAMGLGLLEPPRGMGRRAPLMSGPKQ
jgi:Spy/CpxP family protein refolding chaperone